MPISSGVFTRIWTFVDRFIAGDDINRADLDEQFDDVGTAINTLLSDTSTSAARATQVATDAAASAASATAAATSETSAAASATAAATSEAAAELAASQAAASATKAEAAADLLETANPGTNETTFTNLAAMVASSGLTVGDYARTLGYITPFDGGGNRYQIVAAATGTADGGLYVDLTGISGQALALFPEGFMRPEQFGARGDAQNALYQIAINDFSLIFTSGTDDAAAMQACIDAGATTLLPIHVTSHYRIGTALTYPDLVTAEREAWGHGYCPTINGIGRDKCGFVFSATTGDFLSPASGIGETPRGQRLGGVFEDFYVQGPGSLANEQHGLCIDNVRGARGESLRLQGFPTGAPLRLSAFNTGGNFGGDWNDIQIGERILPDGGDPHDVTVGGQFWLTTCRWGVLLEGPTNGTNGKTNAQQVPGLYLKNFIEAGVATRDLPGQTYMNEFFGDGATAAFSLTFDIDPDDTDPDKIVVYKNGVLQARGGGSDYVVSLIADRVTFNSTPADGDYIRIEHVDREYASADCHFGGFHIFTTAVKIEHQQEITAATSNTVSFAANAPNDASGLYDGSTHTGYRFKAFIESGAADGDLFTITDDTVSAGVRTITIDGTWSTTPSAGDLVTIEVGNDDLTSKYGIADYPAGLSLDMCRNYYIGPGQIEEPRVPMVIWSEEAVQSISIAPLELNTYARGIVYKGTGDTSIRSQIGHNIVGMDDAPSHAIQTGDFDLNPRQVEPAQTDEPYGLRHPGVNDTGGTVTTGDVLIFDTSVAYVSLVTTTTIDQPRPVVVDHSREGGTYADGAITRYRASGNASAKVTGAVAIGDPLVTSTLAKHAQAYPGYNAAMPATWPPEAMVLGYALQANASGEATIKIKVQPRS